MKETGPMMVTKSICQTLLNFILSTIFSFTLLYITPVLFNLHWLPVFYRIYFKFLILTFKAIYNMSPSYICNLVSTKSGSVYSLRSNSSLILDRPKWRILSTLGGRSFYAAAPTLRNSLPANIREITSLNIFKKKLKAYLFNLAYNK